MRAICVTFCIYWLVYFGKNYTCHIEDGRYDCKGFSLMGMNDVRQVGECHKMVLRPHVL